jgi:hypothetical protein
MPMALVTAVRSAQQTQFPAKDPSGIHACHAQSPALAWLQRQSRAFLDCLEATPKVQLRSMLPFRTQLVAEKHQPGKTLPPETCESPSVRTCSVFATTLRNKTIKDFLTPPLGIGIWIANDLRNGAPPIVNGLTARASQNKRPAHDEHDHLNCWNKASTKSRLIYAYLAFDNCHFPAWYAERERAAIGGPLAFVPRDRADASCGCPA